MTLSTYGMEVNARKTIEKKTVQSIAEKVVGYIEQMLPPELRGCIKGMKNQLQTDLLAGRVQVLVEFPEHGREVIDIQVALMTTKIDVVEQVAICVRERWNQLNS